MAEGRYDLIVIGGGVGGLATAALAARHGLRPMVLEQGAGPGGACATLTRNAYRFDAGAGLLWGFEAGEGARRVVEAVGAAVEALPLEPAIQVALPRHRFAFYRAEERFWREVRREFPAAETALRSFYAEVRALDAALRALDLGPGDLPSRPAWRRWRRRDRPEDELQKRALEPLESLATWQALPPELQEALALVLRYLGPVDPSAPVLLAATILGRTRRGFTGLRGGTGALATALVQVVERHGGVVQLGMRATEVLLRGRRAAGARTANGFVLEAPAVVAAVAPMLLAGHLLQDGARLFPGGIPTPHAAAFTLYLGLDEAIVPAEMGPHLLLRLPRALEPGGIDALSLSTSPPWDGSRAPRGRRALTVNAFLPPRDIEMGGVDWLQMGERILNALDDFLPGLRGRMDYCEVRSPVNWQEQTGRPYGAAGYLRGSLPMVLGWQGFPHRTPVPALFVAGDWTFPGGGVAAAVEGAQRTLDLILAARR